MLRQICGLANIGNDQAWICKEEPGQLNGSFAEGAKISEQCLDTGNSKEKTSEISPALLSVANKEGSGEAWAESLEHTVIVHNQVVYAATEVKKIAIL
jgi:hypothetical protein